jgi:hypothetical protein
MDRRHRRLPRLGKIFCVRADDMRCGEPAAAESANELGHANDERTSFGRERPGRVHAFV